LQSVWTDYAKPENRGQRQQEIATRSCLAGILSFWRDEKFQELGAGSKIRFNKMRGRESLKNYIKIPC